MGSAEDELVGELCNGLCFSELKKETRGRDWESTALIEFTKISRKA